MALCELMEKSADTDLPREIIGVAAEHLMGLDVGGLTGVTRSEKGVERLVKRSGYCDRDRKTRAGMVELRILKPR